MVNETIATIRRKALAALIPPPRRRLSEWIEENVWLPEGVTAEPGKVRLWPHQREIADAIGDPTLERVTMIKPVRVGFTTLLSSAVAGYIANDPAPILCLLPTESDCRDYMVSDLEPIFEASPALSGLIGDGVDDSGRNTILSRRFAGGSLKIVAAKAQRNLRRHNIRILLMDEVDGYEAGREGSSITLAERRTLQFADRKIIIGSTPVFEETSNVIRAYASSDKRVYEVPCPSCGEFHEIMWTDIRWPEGEPEKAYYCCPSCGGIAEDSQKPAMVAAGRWRATAPAVRGHAGFRMNALISLLANTTWAKLATEFLEVKDDPERLQTFVNTILGQGWKEHHDQLDEAALASRVEQIGIDMLSEDVLAITAGCDVQRDRLECTLIGWAENGTAFILAHYVVWGLPEDHQTWADLDGLLKTRFKHPLGGSLGIDAAAVDSGDGQTMEMVYKFCFPRANRKIVAIKGVGGNRPWIERSKSKTKGGWLWIVGVDGIKAHLMSRLSRAGTIRFSDSLPRSWFEQLTAERIVIKYNRGQPTRIFDRIPGRAAEALDCTTYAFAARQIITVNADDRRDALRRGLESTAPKVASVIKSNWLR